MSRSEPSMAVKALTMVLTSMWKLPHSLSSTTSSRARSVTSGFYRSAHRIGDPPCLCISPPARTRDRDGSNPDLDPGPTSANADPSGRGSSSEAAPSIVEGVSGMDAETCPIAASTEGTSGVPSSTPTSDVMTVPSHASPTMGTLEVPSSVRSPTDAPTSCTPPIDAATAPASLSFTSGVELAGSWYVSQMVRVFFGVSLRRVLLSPTLRRIQ